IPEITTVLPEPDADVELTRVLDELAKLVRRPPLPEPFDQVVLEPEPAGQAREILHLLDRVLAAIEISPDGAPRLDPLRRDPLRKDSRVGRRGKIVDNVAVDNRLHTPPKPPPPPRGAFLSLEPPPASPAGPRPPCNAA